MKLAFIDSYLTKSRETTTEYYQHIIGNVPVDIAYDRILKEVLYCDLTDDEQEQIKNGTSVRKTLLLPSGESITGTISPV